MKQSNNVVSTLQTVNKADKIKKNIFISIDTFTFD